MVERVYDTIKGILWTSFPKNTQGVPAVYDRTIQQWFLGDRKIYPSPLGVVLRGTQSNVKDIGYGMRELEYTFKITIFSSNDDQDTSERVVQEAARVANQILKNHRTLWVCDLCPFTGTLPLSPIHYVDNGVITNVGINTGLLPSGTTSYRISVTPTGVGYTAPAYIRLSQGISGKVTVSEILSCGLGIATNSYVDSYVNLSLTLSSGSGMTGYSTTLMSNYLQTAVSQINAYWAETHSSSSPEYLDWPGVAFKATQMLTSDWEAGFKDAQITANTKWNTNLNTVANNKVDLVRLLQDIEISSITPSDDGVEAAFLHTAEFTMRAKEIVNITSFGPNNVDVNAV